MARILAARLQPLLKEKLFRTQYCGVPGNTILDAVTQVRDAIGYSESTKRQLCIVFLDSQQASDRISHQFLFYILPSYGITQFFFDRIRTLYENATAAVQVN
jgi:hypothetical protein